MTPERAAQVLGIAPDADVVAIQRAWTRRARVTHPDVDATAGAADRFREAREARDTLLAGRGAGPHDPSGREDLDPEGGGARRYVDGDWQRVPMPQPRWMTTAWAGLLVLAAFLAIYGVPHPFTIAEPLLRWAVLIGATLGYALTGRRGLMYLAVVAIIVTVLITVFVATLGGLVALLIILPAVLGAFTGGLAQARRRAERAAR